MPWLNTQKPADPSAQTWQAAFKAALSRRFTTEQLAAPLRELKTKHPVSGDNIATILMGFRGGKGSVDDPLLFRYAEHLLKVSYIGTGDLLLALLMSSRFADKKGKAQAEGSASGLPTCEERMFMLLAQLHHNDSLSLGPTELHRTVYALIRWLRVSHEHETNKHLDSGGLHTLDYLAYGMYDSLASLGVTVFGKPSFRGVAKQPWWKERRSAVAREMVNFDMHVLQWMQSQRSGQLQALSRTPPFVETDADGRPAITGQQILESVTDLPITHTRAGLYIWLNASLCGRPLTDDATMLGYLQARYPGDNQTLAVALLTAAFDVLTNTMLRQEGGQSLQNTRSFICNKVPLLLSMSAGLLAPMAAETCIQMAFMQITMDVLPPITTGAAELREMLKQTRAEFLQACALHHLVSENTIGSILQEPPMALPRSTRYTKDGLVNQCNNNVGRFEGLVQELQGMHGNAGAVAGCIVEVVDNLCISKDTMSLKTVCNILIKRVPDMDVVMQYTQPANLLMPLCTLLNDWVHDQDQTEFTPSYEEFASILLFTLAIIHRYDLTAAEVGVAGSANFVFELMRKISSSTPLADLTEEQSAQLTKWVENLFATDEHGDTAGISDEVMRQCPPQAFYALVPTLFEHSVLACKSNTLPMKTFKGGLELLLEPSLLPSLIGGLSWLVKHTWEDHGDADGLLQMLDKLLKPSSTSQETQAMHKAILVMMAAPLVRSLQVLLRKRPDKKTAHTLIELLKPYIERKRTMQASRAEAEEWAATRNGGWARSVRDSVRDMVVWTSSVGSNPPPRYTHRMFQAACQAIGSERVLAAIVLEVKEQSVIGAGAQAINICVAMICAPGLCVAPMTPLTVKDHLRLTMSDASILLQRPLAEAEALVRLSRRMEAQLAVPQTAQLPFAMPVQDQTTDQMMHELGLADVPAAGPAMAATTLSQPNEIGQASASDFSHTGIGSALDPSIDLTGMPMQGLADLPANHSASQAADDIFGELNMDMGQPAHQIPFQTSNNTVGNGGNNQQNQEEDIFADLDVGDIGDDYNFG